MTEYNTLNVKLSNLQPNKLKPAIKNGTAATLNLSSNFIRSSNDQSNFPHKLLLSNTQVSIVQKVFENGLSAYIKFSKNSIVENCIIRSSLWHTYFWKYFIECS